MAFNPNLSFSFEPTDITEEILFGSGKLSGYFAFDDFRVGEGIKEIHIKQQTLGLITYEEVLDTDYDAIVGLAYPAMAEYGTPVFDSMI